MNYVLYKTEVWQRASFSDEADMQEIAKMINEGNFMDIFNDELGFEENDTLYDTESYVYPEDNDDEPTLEVYEYNQEIYNNGNNNTD